MFPCPYCGEKISKDARFCRHCQRATLYSVRINKELSDREAHSFIKEWQAFDKADIRHLPLSIYSSARSELQKIPATLAWDLTLNQAEAICAQFDTFKLDKIMQGGLPSTVLEQAPVAKSGFSFSAFLYFIIALGMLSGSYIFLVRTNPRGENIELDLTAGKNDHSISSDDKDSKLLPPTADNKTAIKQSSWGPEEMERILNATVFIRDQNSLGSGFIISEDGYILSNAHVTSGMETPRVILRDGRQFEAEKISEDTKIDASLIRIKARDLPRFELGDANKIYAGENILTIGNPGGLSFTVTRGIVSYVGREIEGVPFIQTDAAINRGNSGGPMITEDLKVVGINSLTSLNEQGISFALPINLVCRAGGLANNITSCDDFKRVEAPVQASLQRPKTTPKSNQDHSTIKIYQDEVNANKQELKVEEQRIDQEAANLKARIKSIQEQVARDPTNGTLQSDAARSVDEIQKMITMGERKRVEAKIRYLRKSISLLERERADPLFENLRGEIETQMNTLQSQKNQLESELN